MAVRIALMALLIFVLSIFAQTGVDFVYTGF